MIRERRDGATVVFEKRPGVVAALLALCALVMLLLGLAASLGYGEPGRPAWVAFAIGGVLAGVLAAFFGVERMAFDGERRQIRWSKRRLFRHRSGVVAFDDVTAVTLESLSSSESTPSARVVLVLRDGRLPLTDHYSGSPALWRPTLERIRGIVGLGAGGSLEESVRGLVAQGRELEAIRLLRTERSLSLEEARNLVRRL